MPLDNGDAAAAVELHRLQSRIRDRHGLAARDDADLESMLRQGILPDADGELAVVIIDDTAHTQHVAEIAVVELIERTGQPNPRLDRDDLAGPRELAIGHRRATSPCAALAVRRE